MSFANQKITYLTLEMTWVVMNEWLTYNCVVWPSSAQKFRT